MKTLACCLLVTARLLAPEVWAKPLDVVSEDSASSYGSDWSSGTGGNGTGFGKWTMQTTISPNANSHAGFYIASTRDKTDLKGAAVSDKAFGMYANGISFESATAYRAFDQPLKTGQSFSFLMEHGDIVKKFDEDAPGNGSIGLTFRASTDSADTDDYNKNARFEIGYYQKGNVYRIYDGGGTKELEVPLSAGALAITLTLVTADAYNLEITVVATKETTHIDGRKLGGPTGAPISSLCLFDRNGEANDAYFNGFQILQPAK